MDEINTQEALADAETNVPAADGSRNDSEISTLKDVLSAHLGREFPTDEAALKAVKDTFSYVGEYGQVRPQVQALRERAKAEGKPLTTLMEELTKPSAPAETPTNQGNFLSREEYETDKFFSDNPEYRENRTLVEAFALKENKPLREVVTSDSFKSVFEKVRAADQNEKSKSVLMSNQRIGEVTDKFSQASEALKNGDASKAGDMAANAVIDSFDLRK
jgi:hypothetical protein